jgi:hypothetical protein
MKRIIFMTSALLIIISGCIRHSDQGLPGRTRNKSLNEKVNLKKATVILSVNDINRSVYFYKEVAGLEPVAYYPDSNNINFVVLAKGNAEILLEKKEYFNEEFPEYKDSQNVCPVNVLFEVNEILMIYEMAVNKTSIVKELHQTQYGTKEFSIKDIDGYIITFFEPLKK